MTQRSCTSIVLLFHLLLCSLSNDLQLTDGLVNNSQSLTPQPASHVSCSCNNFKNVGCTWNRGGLPGDLKDTLQFTACNSKPPRWINCSAVAICDITNRCSVKCTEYFERCNKFRISTTGVKENLFPVVTFNPDNSTVLNPPKDVQVVNVSSSELSVSWGIPDGLNPQDHLHYVSYTLQYQMGSKTSLKVCKKPRERSITPYIVMCNIRDLTPPYGLYSVRVRADQNDLRVHRGDENIIGAFSESVSCRTSEEVPGNVIQQLSCPDEIIDDKGETKAVNLSWKLVEDRSIINGKLLEFLVSFDNKPKFKVNPNETTYSIDDLSRNRNYTFHIVAVNSAGKSPQQSCTSYAVLKVTSSPTALVIGICIGVFLVMILVFFIWKLMKRSSRKFPDINLQPFESYFVDGSNRRMPKEVEVFDELTPHKLFVALGPEDNTPFPHMVDGFDIGDKPLGGMDFGMSDPLLQIRGDPMFDGAHSVTDLLLPSAGATAAEYDPSSGDEYGARAFSIGSGGSYLHIRDDDNINYSCMTKEGLSPIHKDNPNGTIGGENSPIPKLFLRPESVSEHEDDMSYSKMTGASNIHPPDARDLETPNRFRKGGISTEKFLKEKSHVKKKKEEAREDAYDDDQSISSYVQQGFVPGAGNRNLDQSRPPVGNDSYSQLGVQQLQAAYPSGGVDTNASQPYVPEQIMVEVAVARPSEDILTDYLDSLPDEDIGPYTLSAGRVQLPGTPRVNADEASGSNSMPSPYVDDDRLNYVSIGLDAASIGTTESLEGNTDGYVVQAETHVPIPSSEASERHSVALPDESVSVDQDLVDDILYSEPSNDAVEDGDNSDYVSVEQVLALNGDPTNHNNNSNPRAINGLFDNIPAQEESLSEEDEPAACQAAEDAAGNQATTSSQSLPQNDGYITHDEMQTMADARCRNGDLRNHKPTKSSTDKTNDCTEDDTQDGPGGKAHRSNGSYVTYDEIQRVAKLANT